MQALKHHNGQSAGSCTSRRSVQSVVGEGVGGVENGRDRFTFERMSRIAAGRNTVGTTDSDSDRPCSAITTKMTSTTTNSTTTTVDTTGVQDGDPGNNSGSSALSLPGSTTTMTRTTTRAASLCSPPAFVSGCFSSPVSFSVSNSLSNSPSLSTSPLSSPSASFPLSHHTAPPKRKHGPLPPPILVDGKLHNSTAFLLSPSPPPSALLSPSDTSCAPLPSSPSSSSSSSSPSPSSSLFTASAAGTRASSFVAHPLTATTGNHTSTFLHSTTSSPTSLASPGTTALTAWPEHDDSSDSLTEPNRYQQFSQQLPRFAHYRFLLAAHTSMTATETRNGAASDNFLRASFDGMAGAASARTSISHSHGRNSNNNSRWRPTSARSADRARRRSPSPLFNPFTRVSRHRHDGEGMRASTSNGRRSSYSLRSSLSSGVPPPLTREEFEALPVAIQRKYFSTLERLRFAQGSGTIDGIYQHYDAISAQNIQRRRSRQDRIASDNITTRLRKRSLRLESSSLVSSSTSPSPAIGDAVADTLFYANLPDKIKKREFTREEQVAFAGQLRASVILDAADEAIYKIGRRSSITHRLIAPDIIVDTPTTTTSFRHSMETIRSSSDPRLAGIVARRDALGLEQQSSKRISGVPESFYDSFRWLEEEDDLDLRLFLDDYHSNLRDALPSPSKERRPSFRRHLSISKMPFSRPLPTLATTGSLNSRPATKDDVASMRTATSPSSGGIGGGNSVIPFPSIPSNNNNFSPTSGTGSHMRRKSRTLSLITPKQHSAHDSISTIDPGAAHYQDPEARLKLRVYLASPQKFDEAIEFGFPSTDVLSSTTTKGNRDSTATTAVEKRHQHQRRGTRQSASDGSGTLRTFLADDDDDENDDENLDDENDEGMTKLDSDQASIPDPESPKTPNLVDVGVSSRKMSSAFRPYRISTSTDSPATSKNSPQPGHRPSDSYAQVPASSREMTLRMTLTRLDLRAGEEQIYGWQQKQYHVHHQSSSHGHSHHQSQMSFSGRKSSTQYYVPPREDSLPVASCTTTTTSTCDSTVTYLGAGAVSRPKESIENVFAGIDHWEADQDKGVMKRFWNRVRRS